MARSITAAGAGGTTTRRAWLAATAALPAAGALAGAALGGCAPGGQEAAGGAGLTKIKPGAKVRLHVQVGTEVDTLQERIPLLEQQQNIKVEVEPFPGGELSTRSRRSSPATAWAT